MANVLPLEVKKKILQRLRSRYVLLLALTLILSALIASLALTPSLIFVQVAQESLRSAADEIRASVAEDQAIQVRTLALLDTLTPLVNATTSPSKFVAAALGVRPQGLSITSITYAGGPRGTLVLSGTSKNRQAVNAYRDALEADGHFASVAVPVAALVGTQEGRFTVTLSGFLPGPQQ